MKLIADYISGCLISSLHIIQNIKVYTVKKYDLLKKKKEKMETNETISYKMFNIDIKRFIKIKNNARAL